MGSIAAGVLSAEDVPAGEFDVSIFALMRNAESKTNMTMLTGQTRITVPADPPSGKLDVGEVILKLGAGPSL